MYGTNQNAQRSMPWACYSPCKIKAWHFFHNSLLFFSFRRLVLSVCFRLLVSVSLCFFIFIRTFVSFLFCTFYRISATQFYSTIFRQFIFFPAKGSSFPCGAVPIHFLRLLAFYAAETAPIQLFSGHNNECKCQSQLSFCRSFVISLCVKFSFIATCNFFHFYPFFISNHVISSKHWSGRKQLILFPSNLNALREILRLDVMWPRNNYLTNESARFQEEISSYTNISCLSGLHQFLWRWYFGPESSQPTLVSVPLTDNRTDTSLI